MATLPSAIPTGSSQSPTLGGATYSPALGSTGVGGWLGDVYGEKYGIPNPVSTAAQAISGNTGNLAGIYGLTVGADQAAAAGAQSQYIANLPDYTKMLTQATGNVSSELQGQVPADVINLLSEQGAERGVATGQGPNSPNTNASWMQALGLTSLGLENQGLQGFGQLYADTPVGPQFNPSSMMVTPEQMQAAQLAANEEAAAPDPALAGMLSNF